MDNIYTPRSGNNIVTPGNNSEGTIASSDISRVLPRQLSTGALRGTQNVGYGGVKIDGSNNRIVLGTSGQSGNSTVGNIILDGANSEIDISGNGSKITVSGSSSTHPIITMGEYSDNTFNFRVQDANGVGIAQFGQFPNGSIA